MKQLISIFIFLTSLSCFGQNVERYKEFHDKGRSLILEEKYEQAILQLDTAISIMPYYTSIFQDRGYAYMQLKNYEAAVKDFDYVLGKKKYLYQVRLQRGMALYHLNYISEAYDDILAVQMSSPEKSYETEMYLSGISKEMNINNRINSDQLRRNHLSLEHKRIQRARHREQVIVATVIPLAFWASIFLCW